MAQVYYDVGNGYNEVDSVRQKFDTSGAKTELVFDLPPVSLKALRFDPAMEAVNIRIFSMEVILFGDQSFPVPFASFCPGRHIRSSGIKDDYFYARSKMFTKDPAIEIELSEEICLQS